MPGRAPAFRLPTQAVIDEHRRQIGVESVCHVLQCAPLAHCRHAARQRRQARFAPVSSLARCKADATRSACLAGHGQGHGVKKVGASSIDSGPPGALLRRAADASARTARRG